MLKALNKIERVYRVKYGEDLLITSKRDGNHSAGSLHYRGDAIDCRYPKGYDHQDVATAVRVELGQDFDVVPEGNHLHVEYDPHT